MTTIDVDIAPEPALDPLDSHPAEAARCFQEAAQRLSTRAHRIRRRVEGIDDSLQPLQVAMRRRACQLELTSSALAAIADGFGAHSTQAAPR